MEEELIADRHIVIGSLTLVPVVRKLIQCHKDRLGVSGLGVKEFVGVVVISHAGNHALNAAGEEVPVEEYARYVPEIEALLSAK